MPLNIAAGFPVTYGTAYSAIVTKAKVKIGDVCMILGATGGVGIAAIEIAKALGAKVIACGGDDNKLKEIFIEMMADLKNLFLEKKILELESKFSKNMDENTFNEIKELKKLQNSN